MYTLRKIDKENRECNTNLGNHYSVLHSERNEKEFNDAVIEHYDKDKIHCFVFDEGGRLNAIYKNEAAYIMTDTGKTFDNLSFRK